MAEKTESNGQKQDNKVIVFLDNSARWKYEEDSEENQKISLVSDESWMLDVAQKVVCCSQIHMRSGQYQHTVSEVDDGCGKSQYAIIEGGDRDMP